MPPLHDSRSTPDDPRPPGQSGDPALAARHSAPATLTPSDAASPAAPLSVPIPQHSTGDDRPTADFGPLSPASGSSASGTPFSPASGLGSRSTPGSTATDAGTLALDEGPGTTIGPYRIVETIGEGGFGMVYLAEQLEPVRRRVALKVVKLGMDTKEVLARFSAERQALAMLEHPNIARVFDAGMTLRGRPYFAMEFCPGLTITQYADSARLSTKQRVELMIPVCHAVQHAHSRGIIHRDLKPSNILVTLVDGRPVPKVIDFGIAKATDTQLTDRTLATEHGRLLGTPEYMSPEQAGSAGKDIDPRADVYSLGVILYELLTGTLPFESAALRAGNREQIVRMICDLDPPRPSTRLGALIARHATVLRQASAARRAPDSAPPSAGAHPARPADPLTTSASVAHIAELRRAAPPALVRQIRGDLDWIVLRAMAKARADRYVSADELGEDLERFLAHQPVRAGPPSPIYRLRKFAVRHRARLGAALLLAAAVGVVAVTLALYQRGRTAQTRRVTEIVASAEQRQNAVVAQAQTDKYRAALVLSEAALRDGDFATAARELAEAPTALRGFEWKHLALGLDPSLLAIPQIRPASSAALAFTPDGQAVLAGDATGRLWRVPLPGAANQAASAAPTSTQLGDRGLSALAIDAAGSALAVGDERGTVRVLDLATLAPRSLAIDVAQAPRPTPTAPIPAPAASLALAGNTSAAAASAAEPQDAPDDRPTPVGVVAIAFSPDGAVVAALRADGSATLVHAATGRQLPLGSLLPADGLVQSLLFSQAASGLALTAFTQRAAVTWNIAPETLAALASGRQPAEPPAPPTARAMRLVTRGESYLAATDPASQSIALVPRNLRQIQAQRFLSVGNVQSIFDQPLPMGTDLGSEHALAVAETPLGQLLALGSADGLLRIWTVPGSAPTAPTAPARPAPAPRTALSRPRPADAPAPPTPPTSPADAARSDWTLPGHSGPIAAVALSPRGTHAATLGREDATLRIFSLTPDGSTAAILHIDRDRPLREYPGLKDTLTFSADGRRLAAMASPAYISVWDTATGAPLVRLPAFSASYTLDPQGKLLVGANARGPREVIDVDAARRLDEADAETALATVGLHPGAMMGIADATLSIGRQSGRSLTVTRFGQAEPVRVLPRPASSSPVGLLAGLTFSNSGRFMLFGSRLNTLDIIDLNSGAPAGRLEATRSVLGQFAFAPDESLLYLADGSKGILVWDLNAAAKKSTIPIRGETAGLAVSHDGSRLAVGLRGVGVLILDAATGKELVTLRMGNLAIRSLAFGPDSATLAVSTDTGIEILRTARP